MTAWTYQVRSIILDSYDNIATGLQEALNEDQSQGSELVFCIPAPEHRNGELHQIPDAREGNKPYDDIWQQPTGPTFIAIFKTLSAE